MTENLNTSVHMYENYLVSVGNSNQLSANEHSVFILIINMYM